MKRYKLVNNLLGWFCFAVAAVVYIMTIEPTASFWDCGEFIASAYKLEVGHPPGNPIFMLTANLFTQLASGTENVAKMVNIMSALFSALTILFLFWTITHLAKKLVITDGNSISLGQMISIMGAGLVGAFAYTFSDTFWFSAVEGEVYAFSSLMTALVFWLILKWENVADQPHSDRWIILIAYLMGLSIAVHLLNLLCIPAMVLVYYFKKYPNPSLKGALISLGVSFVILLAILYGLVQGLVEVCGWFELFFVNTLRMPYNSGALFYVILVFGILAWGIWESMRSTPNDLRIKISFILGIILLGIPFIGSGYIIGAIIIIAMIIFFFFYKKNKLNYALLNTILICLFVMTIGYSSYALIVIRSTANTPMNQNAPDNVFTLQTYLTREQYGDVPLFYGETYVSELKRNIEGNACAPVQKDLGPIWSKIPKKDPSEKDRYFISNRKKKYVYVDELNMLFPRMYSQDQSHISAYKQWANIKGEPVSYNICGENKTAMKPTFAENLRFFFSYQVGFMYWRYFMWNFAGRQNDIQGHGDIASGNWISGIKFLDEMRVGPQDDLPYDIAQNKGHNKYYMLPLLLGILGIVLQAFSSGKKGVLGFWVVFTLFFMTGLAIVVYLNQTPYQPRERDYAYAGSFYAFCIWIGLGVLYIVKLLHKTVKIPEAAAASIASVLCLLIPVQMASQTWDDHDRSKRFVARDFGQNYLTTCAPNSIIFTNGDNDTFPLWYAQEVEGYRTDVRVCNLSYLQTDWYIDQMKLQAYESDPLPIKWHKSEYIQGTHDVAYLKKMTDKLEVSAALDIIKTDDQRFKMDNLDILASNILTLPVDSASVIKSGLVKPENADRIPEELVIDLSNKGYITKHEMMILEMLKNNTDWSRPIYYATTVSPSQFLNLQSYFRQDGIAYRIVPYNAKQHLPEGVDTEVMFDKMMNEYKWGGVENPDVYLDENALRMTKTFRMMFGNLVKALIAEGKTEKAEQALDYCEKVLPAATIKYDYSAVEIPNSYFRIGKKEKALESAKKVSEYAMSQIRWYNKLKPRDFIGLSSRIEQDLYTMQVMMRLYEQLDPEEGKKYAEDFSTCVSRYQSYSNRQQGGTNQ
jgi:Apolipoprotein N-acyltransferase